MRTRASTSCVAKFTNAWPQNLVTDVDASTRFNNIMDITQNHQINVRKHKFIKQFLFWIMFNQSDVSPRFIRVPILVSQFLFLSFFAFQKFTRVSVILYFHCFNVSSFQVYLSGLFKSTNKPFLHSVVIINKSINNIPKTFSTFDGN